MESKAGSRFLFYRASLSENRFTLFRTHSNELGGGPFPRFNTLSGRGQRRGMHAIGFSAKFCPGPDLEK